MALPRLPRLVKLLIVIWIAVGIVALILFHSGGTHPPARGNGDQIGLPPTP